MSESNRGRYLWVIGRELCKILYRRTAHSVMNHPKIYEQVAHNFLQNHKQNLIRIHAGVNCRSSRSNFESQHRIDYNVKTWKHRKLTQRRKFEIEMTADFEPTVTGSRTKTDIFFVRYVWDFFRAREALLPHNNIHIHTHEFNIWKHLLCDHCLCVYVHSIQHSCVKATPRTIIHGIYLGAFTARPASEWVVPAARSFYYVNIVHK